MISKHNKIGKKIQKRIGITMSVTLFVIICLNINNAIQAANPGSRYFSLQSAGFNFLLFTLSVFSAIWVNRLMKIFQISVFFLTAVLTILLNDVSNNFEVNLNVFTILLCIQYGFLKKRFVFKLAILLSSIFIVMFVLKSIKTRMIDPSNLAAPIYTLAYLYMIWLIFANEIKEYIHETKKLQQEIQQNFVFVQFGKNISGLIHNLRNRMMVINSMIRLIYKTRIPEISEYCLTIEKASSDVMALVDNLMFAVKSRQNIKPEIVSMNKIILSVIDLFKTDLEFRNSVYITTNFAKSDRVYISPLAASQMVENLICNARDSLREKGAHDLSIETRNNKELVEIIFSDNGTGIFFCARCKNRNCLDCKHFTIGKTTKEKGSGIGMIYIRTLINELNGSLEINSPAGVGTTVTVLLPMAKKVATGKVSKNVS